MGDHKAKEALYDALVEAALQASGRAKKLKTSIDRAGGIYLADRLHRVRIEAK